MRIRLAVIAIALVALLAGLAGGTAAPAQAKGKACWERVIDDWLNGKPLNKYSPKCLQAALKNVPEDLRDYSDITDVISAALQNKLRGGGGGGTNGGTTSGAGSSSGSGNENGDNTPRKLQNVPDRSYYRRAIDNLGTTSADSLPIPLLVLAGLGTALLLTAGGLAARKRLKGRARPPAT
jgi:hypothetical protein